MTKSKSKIKKLKSKYGNPVLDAAVEVGDFASNTFAKHKLSATQAVTVLRMVAHGLNEAIKLRDAEESQTAHSE